MTQPSAPVGFHFFLFDLMRSLSDGKARVHLTVGTLILTLLPINVSEIMKPVCFLFHSLFRALKVEVALCETKLGCKDKGTIWAVSTTRCLWKLIKFSVNMRGCASEVQRSLFRYVALHIIFLVYVHRWKKKISSNRRNIPAAWEPQKFLEKKRGNFPTSSHSPKTCS